MYNNKTPRYSRYKPVNTLEYVCIHELAHLKKHLSKGETNIIIDEFEQQKSSVSAKDAKEREADKIAQEALIPKKYWNEIALSTDDLSQKTVLIAEKLKIHPAIVAGRIRFEKNNYRILSQFVGRREVKPLFD